MWVIILYVIFAKNLSALHVHIILLMYALQIVFIGPIFLRVVWKYAQL